MLVAALFILAALSVFLNLWQWYAGLRFPLHHAQTRGFAPSLSILRPLKGCDRETERCLESWFLQEYPTDYELLFGVASDTDPVCEIVRRLITRYPRANAELLVCNPVLGANPKVSSLCYLEKRARHEHLIISDQDVVIPPRFLLELIAGLDHEPVGLVNCFYIQAHPRGPAMRLEAVAVNADFWTQVLQGNMLKPMDFALGASMATRKANLRKIGGFESLLDYLADDYQLGNSIARSGSSLQLCPIPVECHSEPQTAAQVWKHQLRWARTIRACQPIPYFFSILSNGTLWPLLFLAADASPRATAVLGLSLIARVLTAKLNYQRLTGESAWSAGLIAPIKDLLQVALWGLAFLGNEITWRDQRFRVNRGGKLTPLA